MRICIREDVPPVPVGTVSGYKSTDYMSHEGCLLLCAMIEKAWLNADHPEVKAVPQQHTYAGIPPYWAPRITGLINGAPILPSSTKHMRNRD